MTYIKEEKKIAKEFIECKIPEYIYDFDESFNKKFNLTVDTMEYYEALFDLAHCILDDLSLKSNFLIALKNEELKNLIKQQSNNLIEKNFSDKASKLLEVVKKYIEI